MFGSWVDLDWDSLLEFLGYLGTCLSRLSSHKFWTPSQQEIVCAATKNYFLLYVTNSQSHRSPQAGAKILNRKLAFTHERHRAALYACTICYDEL